jgi:hypothetical protein
MIVLKAVFLAVMSFVMAFISFYDPLNSKEVVYSLGVLAGYLMAEFWFN